MGCTSPCIHPSYGFVVGKLPDGVRSCVSPGEGESGEQMSKKPWSTLSTSILDSKDILLRISDFAKSVPIQARLLGIHCKS